MTAKYEFGWCAECRAHHRSDAHIGPTWTTWRVWDGETEEDGRTVRGRDARHAAERAHELDPSWFEEPTTQIAVRDGDRVRVFEVTVETIPEFTARELAPG